MCTSVLQTNILRGSHRRLPSRPFGRYNLTQWLAVSGSTFPLPLMVQFDPPLSTAVTVIVPHTVSQGSCLRLHAILSPEEHASLSRDGTKVQVWSDFGTGEWSETSFQEEHALGDAINTAADLSLSDVRQIAEAAAPVDTTRLVATMPLPRLVGRIVQFTYRILHASGSVTWLGNTSTNGSISIEPSHNAGLRPEEWHESASNVFSWQASADSGPVIVTELGQGADWRGWAIGKEGTSSFSAVSSAITDRVALALLPKAQPGAYVSYPSVMYHTTNDGTLSLTDNGEIVFHPGVKGSVLQMSTLGETWAKAISEKATVLNLHSPHFLGVSGPPNLQIQCIHILPVSGSKACITLSCSDLQAFVSPSDALFLVDPTSFAAKSLVSSSTENVNIEIQPGGGDLLVLPGYVLRDEGEGSSVACFPRGAGRVTPSLKDTELARSEDAFSSTEYATSESTESWIESKEIVRSSPEGHSSNLLETQMLVLVLHILRFFLGLVSISIPSPPPQVHNDETNEQTPSDYPVQNSPQTEFSARTTEPTSRVNFNVADGFAILFKGDISQMTLAVGGKLLESTPKDVGGIWLFECSAGPKGPELLEITMHK